MKRKITVLLLATLLLILTGCQKTGIISLDPARVVLKPGLEQTFAVTVRNPDGTLWTGTPVWILTNPTVGQLSSNTGTSVTFTPTALGTATLKVSAEKMTASAQIIVEKPVVTHLESTATTIRCGIGQSVNVGVTATDQFGDSIELVDPTLQIITYSGEEPLGEITYAPATQTLKFVGINEGVGSLQLTIDERTISLPLTIESAIEIPDLNLHGIIRGVIQKNATDPIFPYELEVIEQLEAVQAGIVNLEGLQYLANLQQLNLTGNNIADIQPLANLVHLTDLNLSDNLVASVAPLEHLIQMKVLNLSNNQLFEDVHLLYGLEDLIELNLAYNTQISDISIVQEMDDLERLNLNGMTIHNLSPLTGKTTLKELRLKGNMIGDISVLATCTALESLYANENQIKYLTPLQGLTALKTLFLGYNKIIDLTPLAYLKNLQTIEISNNEISDISPLVANDGLGAGDSLSILENYLDLSEGSDDMQNIHSLEQRGVYVDYQ